ncbi:Uncharacterised protein [uncultured archaeon]|nr:Uncharacterised protein [uncultured archaeon]
MSAIIVCVGSMNSKPRPTFPQIVSIDAHQNFINNNDSVFWNLSPGGDKSNNVTQWKYPDIDTGYFYMSTTQMIEYEFNIEYIKMIRDLDVNNPEIRNLIPNWRLGYFDRNIQNNNQVFDNNGYAILITEINRLNPVLSKDDFYLESSHTHPKTIYNYIIVEGI